MIIAADKRFIRNVERDYTVQERVDRSREVCDALINAALMAVSVQRMNRIVVYSNRIASQVPESYAGNAFNTLTRALIESEALRVARLWDGAQFERTSIRTAYGIMMSHGVRERLDEVVHDRFEVSEWGDRYSIERQSKFWRSIRKTVPEVVGSDVVTRVTNFRDKHVAHLHRRTVREVDGEMIGIKGRELRLLLRRSIGVIQRLNILSRQASFEWKGAFEDADLYAEDFWGNAKFDIKDRRRVGWVDQ